MIRNIRKLIRKIDEKYLDTISSNWRGGEAYPVEIFINPSKNELLKMTQGGKHPLRFISTINGDLLVWDFEKAEHEEVGRKTGNSLRVKGAIYTPKYVEFFKVKNPEFVYENIKNTYLEKLLDSDYRDNLLRKDNQ